MRAAIFSLQFWPRDLGLPQPPPITAMANSKLLGAFKLPKFDGSPRHWKAWDRSLQRFLGLHQLDYVLQEGFMDLLPHPEAVNANKVVYFLIEEAVAISWNACGEIYPPSTEVERA